MNLPEELHERLKRLTEHQHRSMNATIVVALEEYVSAHTRRAKVRGLARDIAERDAELLRRLAE
ncbi:FitA-like ribbon-helix-helix domain-containing protein [Plantactinospora mayteni]|uniref:FitA-like ribbon-helix-helix domain-containing protein n=1 Tax=Plantactinospora mayteni TaxID=566021 RepID=UPI001EF54624|nr:Arc family DNA-binding protein [Plantactinospora mayteni]